MVGEYHVVYMDLFAYLNMLQSLMCLPPFIHETHRYIYLCDVSCALVRVNTKISSA